MRAALAEQPPVAARVQRSTAAAGSTSVPVPSETVLAPIAEPRGARVGRQHERAGRERRMRRVDVAARREDDDLGRGGEAELAAQLGEGAGASG